MELWLDTADLKYVTTITDFGLLTGVTTNPSIMAKVPTDPWKLIQDLLEISSGRVAVQVLSQTAEDMIQEAKILTGFSTRILPKIPTTQAGLKAMHALACSNIPTLATAIYSLPQALLAFKASAQYLAPYLGRIEDATGDSADMLMQMQELKNSYGFTGKIMGAGLRNLDMLKLCLKAKISAATLPASLFAMLIEDNHYTLEALTKFTKEWETSASAFDTFMRMPLATL
jgi:transaldolase